jgi:EAL domain-containing protein (putative c-di-GMP-specific phosphodiesterase class I)
MASIDSSKIEEEAMKTIMNVMDNDEFITSLAKYARKLYLALVEQGFTTDEALGIVSKMQMK